jgi:hypothetical protein
VAIFNGSGPAFQFATVTNSATAIYNSTTSIGTSIAFPTGVTLKDITVVNTGATQCFVGQSGVTSATGIPLGAGQQLTIQGYTTAQGGGNVLFAITASGSTTVECSLATLASVA